MRCGSNCGRNPKIQCGFEPFIRFGRTDSASVVRACLCLSVVSPVDIRHCSRTSFLFTQVYKFDSANF